MKHLTVTVQVDGEIIKEKSIPAFSLPFVKWLCKLCNATISVTELK